MLLRTRSVFASRLLQMATGKLREKENEAYLRKVARKHDGYADKFTSPSRRSVPDRVCTIPCWEPCVQYVEVKPEGAAYHHDRGQTLQALGRTEEALRAFDKAIGLRPENADFHRDRGLALRELGRLEEALTAEERAGQLETTQGNTTPGQDLDLQPDVHDPPEPETQE